MATRLYNLGDAPTRPALWADAQDAATIALDANSRVTSWSFKGTTAGVLVPPSTGQAPLYQATAIAATYPGFFYDSARIDRLFNSDFTGPTTQGTMVLVWQEPNDSRVRGGYSVAVDFRQTPPGTVATGGRLTFFNRYGGASTLTAAVENLNGGGSQPLPGATISNGNSPGSVNVLVIEVNGSSSRIYRNGAEVAWSALRSILCGVGFNLGGKSGDTATYFSGQMGEIAVFPAVFTGDAWDRITQGTMWKWGQQALIADGSTYKTAAPTVETVAGGPDSATQIHTMTSPTAAFRTPVAVNPASHAHAASSPTLTAGTTMVVQDLAQAHASTSPTVSARQALAPSAMQQAHAATPTGLLYQTTVQALASIQAQAMTAAGLGSGAALLANDATQAHAVAVAALTARRALVSPNSLAHAQAASSPAYSHVTPPDTITPDPLDFGVDLGSIRDRLVLLKYFLSVTDVLDASEALDETLPAAPPAAFVGVAAERADPNKTVGGHSQRVRVEIAILFAESTSRFDRDARDQLEMTRKAVIRQLVAWVPNNAGEALEYSRYRIVKIGDGLAWGEVTFSTSYRLTI